MVAMCSGKVTDYDPGYVQNGPTRQFCGTQLSKISHPLQPNLFSHVFHTHDRVRDQIWYVHA